MDPAGRPGQVGTPARRVSHTLAHSGGWAVRTLPGAFLAGDGPSTRGDAGDTGWGGSGEAVGAAMGTGHSLPPRHGGDR